MNQEKLEKEVIERIIKEEGGKEHKILNKQLHKIKVKNREFTGHGFFTEFILPYDTEKCKKESFSLGDRVYAKIEGFKHTKAGFVLFIKNGKIDVLEGYCIGNEIWQEKMIKKFKIEVYNKN